jgi:AsmA protein
MKAAKVFGIAAGAVVAAILLIGLLVSVFFDPNDYRGEIADQVRQKTGRTLEIDGDLKLGIFPWLAVDMGSARLSEAPGFGDQPFLEIQAARAGIRLMPLLRKEIKISELRLDGLRLRLLKDASGRANWSDLEGESTAGEAKAASPEDSPGMASLEIGGIVVKDAAVFWQDRQTGQTLELTEFALATGPVKMGQAVDLDTSFLLALDKELAVRVAASSKLEASEDLNAVAARDLALDLDVTGPGLPGGSVRATSSVQSVDLGMQAGELHVKGLKVEALGASLEAQLDGTGVLSASPRIKGTLQVPSLSPRDILSKLGSAVDTGDPKALTEFSLAATLDYDGKTANLTDLAATLDQTRLQGRLSLLDIQKQAFSFDLALDSLDLDRYLPPPEASESGTREQDATDSEFDLSSLKTLNATGQLKAGELRLSGLVFTDAQVSVDASNGVLRLHPLKTRFYGGQYDGDVRLDASGEQASLSLNEHLVGVQLAPVLKVLSKHEFLSGSAGGGFTLSATGKSVKGMLASLAGNLDLSVTDGALEGVDLVYELQRAQSLLAKQAPPARTGAARTLFDAMKVSAKVDKGVLTSDDLDISASVLKVTGAGGVSLVEQTLDYKLNARVQEAPPADAGQDLGQLRGATIPLRISGTLSEPKVSVDIQGAVKEKLQEELEDTLREKLKKKLFKN